jgi:hypothetical protein
MERRLPLFAAGLRWHCDEEDLMDKKSNNRGSFIGLLIVFLGILMFASLFFVLARQESKPADEARAARLTSTPALITDFSTIHEYADQETTAQGCLEFVCPEHPDAEFPQDCLIAIHDPDHKGAWGLPVL